MNKPERLAGWIPSAERGFSNARDFIDLSALPEEELDKNRLAYFETYRQQNFNGPFIPGWGTESILDALAAHHVSGRWLDLGAGTSTLFWSIPLTGITEIACADIVPEALAVLRCFADTEEVPRCYADALDRYGKTSLHLVDMRRRIKDYWLFDIFSDWPPQLRDRRFDLITEFGVFELSNSPELFARNCRRALVQLAPGGRLIGASWRRSAAYIAESGLDTSFVSAGLIRDTASAISAECLAAEETAFHGDDNYDSVVAWAMRLR